MPPVVMSSARWLRYLWLDLLLLALLLTGVGLLFAYRLAPAPLQPACLATLLAVVLAVLLAGVVDVLLWPGLLKLFGPILFLDLVRTARKGQYLILRCLYGLLLLAMLFLLYSSWFLTRKDAQPLQVFSGATLKPSESAQFALAFFYVFMGVQFLAVLLLTPAYAASAVTEEKERQTLDFLFTTDLRSREILLGKLVARLAYLACLLLTGLPVLCLLPFLGGVEPELVLGGFAVAGLTLLSLAGLSLLVSAFVGRTRTAVLLTYLVVAVYLIVAYFVATLWPGPGNGLLPDVFNAANLIWVYYQVREASQTGKVAVLMPDLVRHYAVLHILFAAGCVAVAVAGLRVWSRLQASGGKRRSFALAWTQKRLPCVGTEPMRWKELYAEPMFRFSRTGVVVVGTVVAVSLILGLFITFLVLMGSLGTERAERNMNRVVGGLGTFVGCLMLAGVAVRAAGSVSGERERQTLDGLLSCPLDNGAILRAKWLGSLLCTRKLWWYLGVVWVVGLLTGGLHLVALVWLLAAWLVYAAFLASLGLWCSLVCRSSLRAVLWTILTALGLSVVGWIATMCCNPLLLFLDPANEWSLFVAELPVYGVSPPAGLYTLTFSYTELQELFGLPTPKGNTSWTYEEKPEPYPLERLLACFGGLACYAGAAVVLWVTARVRFTRMAGRGAVRRAAPPPKPPRS